LFPNMPFRVSERIFTFSAMRKRQTVRGKCCLCLPCLGRKGTDLHHPSASATIKKKRQVVQSLRAQERKGGRPRSDSGLSPREGGKGRGKTIGRLNLLYLDSGNHEKHQAQRNFARREAEMLKRPKRLLRRERTVRTFLTRT